jgi:hypothetical protein
VSVSRQYTSAAKRAKATPMPGPSDTGGLLAWVGQDRTRARQALRELDAVPASPADHEARRPLVEALLDVFPSFSIDGETFRVMGEVQLLDLCELMRLNKRNVKTVDPTGIAALADFFRGALGDEEYERFREFTRANCTDPDLLNDIMEGIVEDLTEVPTSRPSHSVGGPSSSGLTSRVVSLSQGTVSESPMSAADFQAYLDRQQQQPEGPLSVPTQQGPGFVSFG